jgi:hypothetical protein
MVLAFKTPVEPPFGVTQIAAHQKIDIHALPAFHPFDSRETLHDGPINYHPPKPMQVKVGGQSFTARSQTAPGGMA